MKVCGCNFKECQKSSTGMERFARPSTFIAQHQNLQQDKCETFACGLLQHHCLRHSANGDLL